MRVELTSIQGRLRRTTGTLNSGPCERQRNFQRILMHFITFVKIRTFYVFYNGYKRTEGLYSSTLLSSSSSSSSSSFIFAPSVASVRIQTEIHYINVSLKLYITHIMRIRSMDRQQISVLTNNNNNSSFISTDDNPQLIYNKLPRRTAQIQSNTKNQL